MLTPYVGHTFYECYTYMDVLYDVLCVYIFMIIRNYTCLYVYIHAYHMFVLGFGYMYICLCTWLCVTE